MKLRHAIISITFLLTPASPLFPQADWQQVETLHFRIYYTQSETHLLSEIIRIFEAEHAWLQEMLEVRLLRRADVFVAPNDDVFNNLTGNLIPHWGEGVADPSRGRIVVKRPDVHRNLVRFPRLVRHELVHLLIGQGIRPPNSVPTWFHEGMATFFSYDDNYADGQAISRALLGNSILTLEEIDEVLRFHQEKAHLAYEESYSAILYLEESQGKERIIEFLKSLPNGKPFEDNFYAAFAIDFWDFQVEWYRFIEKKYRWRFLLDIETALWLLFPILLILGFLVIKLRNRRTLKRWEAEEGIDENGDDPGTIEYPTWRNY